MAVRALTMLGSMKYFFHDLRSRANCPWEVMESRTTLYKWSSSFFILTAPSFWGCRDLKHEMWRWKPEQSAEEFSEIESEGLNLLRCWDVIINSRPEYAKRHENHLYITARNSSLSTIPISDQSSILNSELHFPMCTHARLVTQECPSTKFFRKHPQKEIWFRASARVKVK